MIKISDKKAATMKYFSIKIFKYWTTMILKIVIFTELGSVYDSRGQDVQVPASACHSQYIAPDLYANPCRWWAHGLHAVSLGCASLSPMDSYLANRSSPSKSGSKGSSGFPLRGFFAVTYQVFESLSVWVG